VESVEQHRKWNELVDRHHYLGAPGLVGANLKYLVSGCQGELLGAVGWQSAVKDLGCRDRLVGWDAPQRARELDHVVNGIRFLILPWVRVRHLASVMLSESLRVLQRDWPRRYGTAVWLVESFVDPSRFTGTSYRAANWVGIGWTRGFAKRRGRFVHHGQRKEVYVYVIEPRMRQWVHQDVHQPLLSRSFLLARREVERQKTFARRERMQDIQNKWEAKIPPGWDLKPEDLQNVDEELKAFAALFGSAFGRVETRELCEFYLRGLLSNTERKNVEAMALELRGPDAVRSLQRFVSEYECDEETLRQTHWKEVGASLTDPQGVWCVDASEFPKKGEESVGVAHQYCGVLGKTANCQSGVFVCYVSPQGHALVESRLYLPQCWFEADHEKRRQQCHIPAEVTFQTKPQLAGAILRGVVESGHFAGQWITCDCSFGSNEAFLEGLPADYYYLAEVACTHRVWPKAVPGHPELERDGCTVEDLVSEKGLLKWETLRVCEGQKGPIVAGFARLRVYVSAQRTPASERWLLLRNDPSQNIKYALSNAPETCELLELVRVSGARWPIERCFQEDKGELGLDHYEHRSWTAWHRHMRLTFLAQLFLVRLRLRLKKTSSLTLPQARLLLEWSFPHPRRDLDYVLALVEYHQARNDCAYRSHRKRRLKEFASWKTLELSG
jgi:SRSO17 transposase